MDDQVLTRNEVLWAKTPFRLGICVVMHLSGQREGRDDQPDGAGRDHNRDGEIPGPSGDHAFHLSTDHASRQVDGAGLADPYQRVPKSPLC